MDKAAIAGVLEEIGTLLELKGENPFKVRAYHNGARVLSTLAVSYTHLDVYKRQCASRRRLWVWARGGRRWCGITAKLICSWAIS